jgi:hypothetical protein
MAGNQAIAKFDRGGAKAPPAIIRKVQDAVVEMLKAEQVVNSLEEARKVAAANLNSIKTGKLPDLMMQMGQADFTVLGGEFDGAKVKMSDFVSGSLPKDEVARQKAIDYISENDGEGLIKTELTIAFGKGESNMAGEIKDVIEKALKKIKSEAVVTMSSGIHAQTLCAYARERMKDGKPLDLQILPLYTGKQVSVTMPKDATATAGKGNVRRQGGKP